jgi:hypothetical protein
MADAKRLEAPEGMRGDHEAAGRYDSIAKLLDRQQVLDVLLVTKDQDIPLVGGEFVSPEDRDLRPASQFFDLLGLP